MEGGDLILDLGTAEGRLPKREQSRLENFAPGDRIRGAIVRVEKTTRGPQVIISRIDPALLKKLFEMEVPEVYDGTVVIKMAARDTGERSKIAVYSKDRDVDPVGACVGMKGSRVQAIIRELHGEKIDIIAYSEDPSQFAMNALSPAKISRANVIDPIEKHLEVIVETDQLSLAIGKKGQGRQAHGLENRYQERRRETRRDRRANGPVVRTDAAFGTSWVDPCSPAEAGG
jgi:N utilization substance protein A